MSEPYVVTISHQLGCGGALVGEKLAQALGVPFVDREILRAVSQRLHIAEADIKSREGRLSSFWQAFSRAEMLADPIISVSADCLLSDKELFDMESDVIARIARNSSAVILGRGGRYILRDHPRHLSVFVHAQLPDRVARVAGLFHVPADVAGRMIEKNDRERAAYIRAFTKSKLTDARGYDLCVNTSCTGLDGAVKLILGCAGLRLGI